MNGTKVIKSLSGLAVPFNIKNTTTVQQGASIQQFYFGEVLSSITSKGSPEYKLDSDIGKVSLRVMYLDRDKKDDDIIRYAYPLNRNTQQIPLPGEIVLVLTAPTGIIYNDNYGGLDFYIAIVAGNFSVNYNGVPPIDATWYNEEEDKIRDPRAKFITFKEQNTAALKPYEGDIIFQGRFGSTIRLGGSFITKDNKDIPSNINGPNGSPFIALRTSMNTGMLSVEDVSKDGSSIYLCEGQKIDMKGQLAIPNTKLRSWTKEVPAEPEDESKKQFESFEEASKTNSYIIPIA